VSNERDELPQLLRTFFFMYIGIYSGGSFAESYLLGVCMCVCVCVRLWKKLGMEIPHAHEIVVAKSQQQQ